MQKLKSIFISTYCTYLTLVAGWGLYQYLELDSKAMLIVGIQHFVGVAFFIG